MKVKDFLTEDNWTQDYFARDKSTNNPVRVDFAIKNPDLCKFCLLGALLCCYPDGGYNDAAVRFYEIADELNLNLSIGDFNDSPGRKFSEIKELLEKADI